MLHNMAGNDYRSGRAVLHCVIPVGLRDAVGVAAGAAGLSVTAWVTGVLEQSVGQKRQQKPASPQWAEEILQKNPVLSRSVRSDLDPVVVVADPLEEIA